MRPQRPVHPDPRVGDNDTIVFDRDRHMFACPECGTTTVPTDDCVPDLVVEHQCDIDRRAPRQRRPGSV